MLKAYLTPPQLSAEVGVKLDNVLAWIHSGELQAVNMAANPNGQRPRWRIARDEIERFFLARSNKPKTPVAPTRRRRRRRKLKPARQWV